MADHVTYTGREPHAECTPTNSEPRRVNGPSLSEVVSDNFSNEPAAKLATLRFPKQHADFEVPRR